eukprot:scaffold108033_cov36-Phaeocystis_antarctica.AAC.1
MDRRKGRREFILYLNRHKGVKGLWNRDLGYARALRSSGSSRICRHRRLSATAAVALAAVVQDGDDPRPLRRRRGPGRWPRSEPVSDDA